MAKNRNFPWFNGCKNGAMATKTGINIESLRYGSKLTVDTSQTSLAGEHNSYTPYWTHSQVAKEE
jgi:hypothetical protein